MTDELELLQGAHRDFNARRIDAVLARMHPDVEWANGMEGGTSMAGMRYANTGPANGAFSILMSSLCELSRTMRAAS